MGNYEEFGNVGLQAAYPPSHPYSVGVDSEATRTDAYMPVEVAKGSFWKQHRYWVWGVVLVAVIGAVVGGAVGGVLSTRKADDDPKTILTSDGGGRSGTSDTSTSASPTMSGTATPVAVSDYYYPTPVSWGPQHLHIFSLNNSGTVLSRSTTLGNRIESWSTSRNPYLGLGGAVHQDLHHIAANCRRKLDIDVYVVGTDLALYRRWYNGTSWNTPIGTWKGEGGVLLSPPSAVSWSKDRRDVFAIGTDFAVYQKYSDGEGEFSDWSSLGGNWSTYSPTVISRERNTLDIILVGREDKALYTRSWNGSSWSPFLVVGGYCTSRPAAVSWSSKRIDAVVRGGDSGLWHISYNADTNVWSNWTSISGGTQIEAEPDIVSWSDGRLDIFAWGKDKSLLHKSFDGKTWTPNPGFETLGTDLSGPPKAVSDTVKSLHVFAYGRRGNMVHRQWNETLKEWLPREGFHDLGTP